MNISPITNHSPIPLLQRGGSRRLTGCGSARCTNNFPLHMTGCGADVVSKPPTINERGFTLMELMASMALVGLIALGFCLAMYQFILGYNETRDYIQLQNEMLHVVEVLRHGYIKSGLTAEFPLVGLLTAQHVDISRDLSSITITPMDGDVGQRFFTRVSREANTGKIMLNGLYGFQYGTNIQLFPSRNQLIGREQKFQITELRFDNLTPSLDSPALIRYSITGMVRHRPRGPRQTSEDDLRQNVKYARFESTVFISNSAMSSAN